MKHRKRGEEGKKRKEKYDTKSGELEKEANRKCGINREAERERERDAASEINRKENEREREGETRARMKEGEGCVD